ncbi:LysR family transcriptional regulator [Chania multitudinisentens RB-25]|uniref:LysR family transcriptional regulator n=1 Tax=Chania multitudinisentens RB-25 TaxID=1441930 RepID=W0L4M1_9GAMM|nr:LysR family transcriptional regulator [Chania multitudinisentens]AHG18661.1 LysR family transcriptional regulator [Chania multitudinisentens RB-25]
MDRLTSMAVFIKAVDLGSFAAAAVALELSSPMVGKHIRALEQHLGARLLNRTTRRQSLTDVGRAYYERCCVVLAEVEAADALITNQLGEPAGRLRVTMPVHFGRHCVVPVLWQLVERYPKLELDLSFNDRFVDLADDGLDLAIRTGTLKDRSDLAARRVARQHMVVCASPAYLAAHGRPQNIADLAAHQAVFYRRQGHVQPWLFPQVDQPPTEIMPPYRFRFDDLNAIADAAVAGRGLAWLPSWLVREPLRSGALIRLLPDEPAYPYDVFALWLQSPQMPSKLRVTIDALVQELPKFMEC